MNSIQQCLEQLDEDYKSILHLERTIEIISNNPKLNNEQKDANLTNLRALIRQSHINRIDKLRSFLEFPPHHAKHLEKLEEFHKKGSFEESVFIMTKYTEGNNPIDEKLQTIINTVKNAVCQRGYIPRLANEDRYHSSLWDNVEMYLLGCKRGIVIVENQYKPELNPNVMMEWGWMRGMNREVLYLVEEEFKFGRADIEGLLKDRFPWDNPSKAINDAVSGWLKKRPA